MKKYTKHHPEFWINKGFSLEDAKENSIKYSIEFKKNRINRRSLDYWIRTGLSEEEAIIEVNKFIETRKKRFNRYSIKEQMEVFKLSREEAIAKIDEIKKNIFNSYSIKDQMKKYSLSRKEAIEKIEKIKLSNNCWLNKSEDKIKEIKSKISNTVKDNFNKMSDFDFKSMSHHNKEYWMKKGYNEKESIKKAFEIGEKNRDRFKLLKKENPKKYSELQTTSIQYWLNKGLSQEEAQMALKERQATFSLEKCVKKYGKELGLEKYLDRQNRWKLKVFNENSHIGLGKSNISEEIWIKLSEIFPTALFGKNEKFIKIPGTNNAYKYDFTLNENRKIIEFNGTFWHCKPSQYKPDYYHKIKQKTAQEIWDYDRNKIDLIDSKGYKVLTIWEDEYKENKELIIQKCLDFLKTN